MREVIVQFEVFKINELEEQARMSAIMNQREFHRSTWCHDEVLKEYHKEVNELGLHNVKFTHDLKFYGGHSGACMDFQIDTSCEIAGTFFAFCEEIKYTIPQDIKEQIAKNTFVVKISTEKNYNYFYLNSSARNLVIELSGDENLTAYNRADFKTHLEARLREWYDDFCRRLYDALDDNYFIYTSQEYVTDYLEKEGVEFYKDGTIYVGHNDEITE